MGLIHGRPNTYDYHGCRCGECTEAKRAYRQANYERRRAAGPQCSEADCPSRAGHGPLCPRHEKQRVRAGRPAPMGRRDVKGYHAAHRRVYATKGKAAERPCEICHEPAAEWALDPYAAVTRFEVSGQYAGLKFSNNPCDYRPLCVSCHRTQDAIVRLEAS